MFLSLVILYKIYPLFSTLPTVILIKVKNSLYFLLNICYTLVSKVPYLIHYIKKQPILRLREVAMAKLYFKYGAMGSSKSAQALITKFNYEERGMRVWLIKPALDKRDGANTVSSRIGLSAEGTAIKENDDIAKLFIDGYIECDVIIADECQFFTPRHIDALRFIVDEYSVPVLCFGLRTDFTTSLFDGSRRLFEVADSISEIKTICECGRKATVNARLDADGKVVTTGEKVVLGGNDCYSAMCYRCWKKKSK